MLTELITEYRAEVIERARATLARGASSRAAPDALERDLTLFFTELAQIFQDQKAADALGMARLVHRYGAAYECLGDWIADHGKPVTNEERHELNRCLSEAIAHTATEFLAAREELLEKGEVERFELPNLGALNFLLHEALGGGGTVSLRVDAQGKTLGAALLRMEIEVDEPGPDARS